MSNEDSQEPVITFKEFFEGTPPGRWAQVNGVATTRVSQYGTSYPATLPELELHCSTEACNGIRFFSPQRDFDFTPKKWKDAFVSFQCKNCGKTVKTFALFGVLSEDKKNAKLYKLGG